MRRSVLWLTRSVVVTAITFGVVACGDSGDDPTTAGESPPASTTQTTPAVADAGDERSSQRDGDPGTGDEGAGSVQADAGTEDASDDGERVATVVEGMYRDLAAADAAGVCGVMSNAAREQIAQQTLGGSAAAPGSRTCEGSLERFLSAAGRSGVLERTQNVMVRSVEIDGDTATATVSFGGAPGQIQLISEDGDWRFGAEAVAPPGARK